MLLIVIKLRLRFKVNERLEAVPLHMVAAFRTYDSSFFTYCGSLCFAAGAISVNK